MSLITLFSAPKAFSDPTISTLQRNAIGSWKRLPDVEVLLLGEEAGLAQAAAGLDVRHVPGVRRNPSGVPLVSSMVELARQGGDSPLLCIINADILLTPAFVAVVQAMAQNNASLLQRGFVLVSRRWDLDVPAPLDFAQGWDERLLQAVHEDGKLHRPTGSDFFLFPRDCYADVPDFAIGRAGWDNWMIYKARKEGWVVIDGTPSMFVVHQNHDYRHLPGGRPHYDHPETRLNTQLAGGQAATRYTILDATHVLEDGLLRRPRFSTARMGRAVELLLRRVFVFLPENMVEDVARPKRWNKLLKRLLRKLQS